MNPKDKPAVVLKKIEENFHAQCLVLSESPLLHESIEFMAGYGVGSTLAPNRAVGKLAISQRYTYIT